jgi:hypothetical protein
MESSCAGCRNDLEMGLGCKRWRLFEMRHLCRSAWCTLGHLQPLQTPKSHCMGPATTPCAAALQGVRALHGGAGPRAGGVHRIHVLVRHARPGRRVQPPHQRAAVRAQEARDSRCAVDRASCSGLKVPQADLACWQLGTAMLRCGWC